MGDALQAALSSSICLFPAIPCELQRLFRHSPGSPGPLTGLISFGVVRVWRQLKGLGVEFFPVCT